MEALRTPFIRKESTIDNLAISRSLSMREEFGIQAALQAVEDEKERLKSEGLSRFSFFVGIINLVISVVIASKYPTYFWIFYGVEGLILIPWWLYEVVQRYNGALFILDFCWVQNIFGTCFMILLWLGAVPHGQCYTWFLCLYGAATGPLAWACIVLHNGFIFHSVEKTASLFIHMAPVFMTGYIRWYPDKMANDWPGKFPTKAELDLVTSAEVYIHGFLMYAVWLVLHSAWLLYDGIHEPDRGRDTVFGNLYKKMNMREIMCRKTKCDSLRSHAAIYLAIHVVLCSLAFVWSVLCWHFWVLHFAFAVVLVLSAAWEGSGYYEYVFAKKYTKVLKGLLDDKEGRPRKAEAERANLT